MVEIRAFIGHSFTENDNEIVGKFLTHFDKLSKSRISFSWEHAIRMWPKKNVSAKEIPDFEDVELRKLFVRGFITTMLNPKDILFYILFIPTFIDDTKDGTSFVYMFIALSCTYALIGITTKCAIAIFSGKTKKLFASKEASTINYFSSLTLCGLGLFAISKTISNFV